MSGIQIEYLLGIFFAVVGLAELVMPTTPKNGAIVKLIAGILLIVFAYVHFSLV